MKGKDSRVTEPTISPLVVAAHELKSPLSLLRQLALSLEANDISEPERQVIASHMRLVSERALRLTTDLTKAQRLEDSLFDSQPVNSQQLCEEVAYELGPLYQACGRKLVVAPRHRPLLAVAHHDLLRRILLNFADNALYYGDSSSAVELSAHSFAGGDMVRIGVRDHGPALSIDTWRSLRRKLFQASPIEARPGSSGLGLFIAREFANAMNGTVGAIRHHDGASFYIDIQASRQLHLL
jgi:signal transduction histidine kinase